MTNKQNIVYDCITLEDAFQIAEIRANYRKITLISRNAQFMSCLDVSYVNFVTHTLFSYSLYSYHDKLRRSRQPANDSHLFTCKFFS